MIVFLLKSSACLAVFLMFYKLLLEKERMHVFKRYYLLSALVLALVIPSITFVEYIETTPAPTPAFTRPVETVSSETIMPISGETVTPEAEQIPTDYWPIVLWAVYGLGVLLFFLKFLRNLWKIARNIRNNPKLRIETIINVLLKDAIVPHTFFNYVFLNRKKFEAHEIPKDVLVHEATHARQKHSLDVLFIELLQIVFWFNPLLYFFKKSIKLNHEFLADQAVLDQGASATHYQNILLAFASSASYRTHQPSMANAINYSSYSSIKKRFKVMKTRTSKKSILVRSVLLLPLLAILLYSFTETELIQKKQTTTDGNDNTDRQLLKTTDLKQNLNKQGISTRSVEIAGLILDSETLLPLENVEIYDSNGNILSKTDDRGYYKAEFDELGTGEIRFYFSLHKDGYKPIEQKEHWGDLQGKIKSTFYFGLQKKESDSPEFSELATNVQNLSYESVQNNFHGLKPDFELYQKMNDAKKDNQRILIPIDNAYYIVDDSGWIKIKSKADLISINGNRIVPASEVNSLLKRKEVTGMTPLENNEALFAIYTVPVSSAVIPIKEASKKEIRQFNSLAEKYNAQPREKRVIPSGDLKKLEDIYGKMTEEQKADAQPFPECPDPKSPDQEGATKKQVGEYNRLAKRYNDMFAEKGNIRIKKADIDRLEYLHGIMTESQRAEAEPFPDFPEPTEPPTPPKPKSPFGTSDSSRADQSNGGWVVTTSANRNSRNVRVENPLPPVAPTLAMHVNRDDYSSELNRAIQDYLQKNNSLEKAVEAYTKEQKGKPDNLWKIYNEAMESYVAYYNLARKEGNLVQPVPAYKERSTNKKNMPPTPPTPPKPKSPLEILKELKNENVKIILNGKEIDYEEAKNQFEENTFRHVNVRKETGKRPVLEVSTE